SLTQEIVVLSVLRDSGHVLMEKLIAGCRQPGGRTVENAETARLASRPDCAPRSGSGEIVVAVAVEVTAGHRGAKVVTTRRGPEHTARVATPNRGRTAGNVLDEETLPALPVGVGMKAIG